MKIDKIRLPDNGYIFNGKNLHGKFGNILYVIENLFILAKNTKSKSILRNSKHKYDNLLVTYPLVIDFTSPENNNCSRVINDKKLFIFKHYYEDKLFIDKENEGIKYVNSLLKKDYNKFNVEDNDLVINIRGGRDIFRKPREKINRMYTQPPLSYYMDIIENNNYGNIIITTDSTKYNPVIKHLSSVYNAIVIDSDFYDQVSLILRAKNLITTRSTFSLYLARVSENLKRAYVWIDNTIEWNDFTPKPNNSLSNNISVINYSCNDYIKSGEWIASEEQIKLMMSLPINALYKEKI